MIHQTMELDIDYERAGILHKGQKATLTTYIKEMYPGMQKPFHRPMVLTVRRHRTSFAAGRGSGCSETALTWHECGNFKIQSDSR